MRSWRRTVALSRSIGLMLSTLLLHDWLPSTNDEKTTPQEADLLPVMMMLLPPGRRLAAGGGL